MLNIAARTLNLARIDETVGNGETRRQRPETQTLRILDDRIWPPPYPMGHIAGANGGKKIEISLREVPAIPESVSQTERQLTAMPTNRPRATSGANRAMASAFARSANKQTANAPPDDDSKYRYFVEHHCSHGGSYRICGIERQTCLRLVEMTIHCATGFSQLLQQRHARRRPRALGCTVAGHAVSAYVLLTPAFQGAMPEMVSSSASAKC